MKYLAFPFRFLYKLYVGAVFWTSLALLFPIFFVLLRKEDYDRVFRLKRFWSRVFQVFLLIRVQVKGEENLPPPPYIICSNHSSYLDILLFYSPFPDYFLFMGKGELLKWPMFRVFFRKMDIPVHRGNARESVKAFHKALEALRKGHCVAIFPEATIPHNAPVLGSFKNGTFRLAVETGVPIVPVTWKDNYKRLGDPGVWCSNGSPGIARVVIHPPVYPGQNEKGDFIDLRLQVFRSIDSELPEPYQTLKDHGN